MHNKLHIGTLALGAATLVAGCFGHAAAYGEVDAPVVFAEEPTLVVVDPGVWVVRDYDYPVYYVDDYYWVYRDDVWERSRAYDGGWARVDVNIVPRVIVSVTVAPGSTRARIARSPEIVGVFLPFTESITSVGCSFPTA